MLSIGILLWALGLSFSAWEELSAHISGNTAYSSDFLFLLYGVPILLAVSSPTGNEKNSPFLWLDGIQAILTVCLIHISIFSSLPFLSQTYQPISALLLMKTYNIQNLVLAFCATARLFAHRPQRGIQRFYLILVCFLWVYAICAGIYNYITIYSENRGELHNLLVGLPFLGLASAILLTSEQDLNDLKIAKENWLALFIDNASPIFYTLALLVLGIMIIRSHFYLGTFSVLTALAVYGFRSTLLQTRYAQSQKALREAHDRLEEMSFTDALTGVANRRRFNQALEVEWERATKLNHPLSLLLIDVDFFKNLNDRYGHQGGDRCLIEVAGALRSALVRSNDLLARYGGEEFAAILVDTDEEGANTVARRMQAAVRALKIRNETSLGEFATTSIGVATDTPHEEGSPALLIGAADRALYRAKQNGRNRIEYIPIQAMSGEGLSSI